MKPLVLLAALAAAAYYYYLQHPTVADQWRRRVGAAPAASAATPRQHYHSPLDAANNHDSAGFYSNEPAERYELTGPRATRSVGPKPPPAAKGDDL